MYLESHAEFTSDDPDDRQVTDAAQEIAIALIPDLLLQCGEILSRQADRERLVPIAAKILLELVRMNAIDMKKVTARQAGNL